MQALDPDTIIQIHTYAYDPRENSEQVCVDITNERAGSTLPLADWVDLSANDLGCEPGSLFRVDAGYTDDTGADRVVDSVIIEAS